MAISLATVAASALPLPWKLRLLRLAAIRSAQRDERLLAWARNHPAIATGSDWCQRLWWGAAAGEVVRDCLYDPRRQAAVLQLIDKPDWSALDAAAARGGVIIAALHLGPPKVLMNLLLEARQKLLVWTNTRDLPGWLAERHPDAFLDPLLADQRAVLLVRSALHLRMGGLLLGAADKASGERTVAIERLGRTWRFSRGLPALARRLDVPVVLTMALWAGDRIRIVCRPLPPPEQGLADEAWDRAWCERTCDLVEDVVRHEPENLRFLRGVVPRIAAPWQKSPPSGGAATG
jgi:hypothetical protein